MKDWWEWLVPSPFAIVMVLAVTALGIWCSRMFDEDSAEWTTAFFGGMVGLAVAGMAIVGIGWFVFG